MNNIIKIQNYDIKVESSKVIITYLITVNDKDSLLWFKIDPIYKDALSYDVIDCPVICMLSFALRGEYDIISHLPMSEKLYFKVINYFIPDICLSNKIKKIQIQCPTKKTNYIPQKIATAISCGVDSFATICQLLKDKNENYNVDYLTYFNNGAHHGGINGHNINQNQLYNDQLLNIKKFCNENNYKLINIDSNLNEFLSSNFGLDGFGTTHTYRNIGIVLLLQKLIKLYYYAPGLDIRNFKIDIFDEPAHYERYLLPMLSTETTEFINSYGSHSRLEKIKLISEYDFTYNYLNVCYMSKNNCGKCKKCVRTLLELDCLGILDKYKNVFDVDEYKKNKSWYLRRLCIMKHYDEFMNEVYKYIKINKNIKIPFIYKIEGFIKSILRPIWNSIIIISRKA